MVFSEEYQQCGQFLLKPRIEFSCLFFKLAIILYTHHNWRLNFRDASQELLRRGEALGCLLRECGESTLNKLRTIFTLGIATDKVYHR